LAFSMASNSVRLHSVCFAIKFAISLHPKIDLFLTTVASGPFLRLVILFQIIFPAVSASKPAVEEVVAFLAGNLETDVAEAFSRGNGLLAFTADDSRLEFHGLPPSPFWSLLEISEMKEKRRHRREKHLGLIEGPLRKAAPLGA
jgi:hypothetical protein